jgi:hypothetical protein
MVMSNEHSEICDAAAYASAACGCVVVLGLGLGLVVRMLLASSKVDRIAVVEIDTDVIQLVGDYFKNNKRVSIGQGDAFAQRTVKKYRRKYPQTESVWADVWDSCQGDSYTQRLALTARWSMVSPTVVCWGMERSKIDYLHRFQQK